ncbi:hypothetical protein JOF29_002475 [Kribbella aluminosa]|uniref:Sensor domain-containing protein n=1 Tax=Kribbella aluminosa TaxID=416017 RepID=A0ABS4UIB2_9ACTN|nr:hypothetical protein [Kribbella aluminosa]MBP2351392.1 hypothetical protein [Kribbella aluminosa]
MARRLAPLAVLTLAVLTLTACTTQPTPPTPSPAPTIAPLTVEQAKLAALRVADLPKGWDGGVAPDPIPTLRVPITYDPVDCEVLRDPLRDREAPTLSVRGQYFLRRDSPGGDTDATEVIAWWPTSQLPLLQKIAEMLPRCQTLAGTMEGETFHVFARQLPMASLRDGIVLRFGDPADPKLKSGTYTACVVRGGTVLALRGSSETVTTDAAFVRFVTTAVARLDAAVGG